MTQFAHARSAVNLIGLAAFVLLLTLSSPASQAATSSSTFTVNANVLAVCSVTATNLNFGEYDASHPSARSATSTLSVICTKGQDYTVALDAGTGTGAAVNDRKMMSGVHTLDYGLYTNASHTTIWGDGTLSTATVSGTGDGTSQSLTVHGRIPSGQHAANGSYADTIAVSLTY